jgi:hypothetical protein
MLEKRAWASNARHALVLTMAFNLFWLSGCMLVSAVAHKSDFAYALRVLAISPPWLGRVVLGALGLAVYGLGMHATAKHVAQGASLAVSYATAGIVSCGAALFFVGAVAAAVREGAIESFGAAIGLLLLTGTRSSRLSQNYRIVAKSGDYGLLGAAALATIAFMLVLGRGLVVTGNA